MHGSTRRKSQWLDVLDVNPRHFTSTERGVRLDALYVAFTLPLRYLYAWLDARLYVSFTLALRRLDASTPSLDASTPGLCSAAPLISVAVETCPLPPTGVWQACRVQPRSVRSIRFFSISYDNRFTVSI